VNEDPKAFTVVISSKQPEMQMYLSTKLATKESKLNVKCLVGPMQWYDFVFACPESSAPKQYRLYFRGDINTNNARYSLHYDPVLRNHPDVFVSRNKGLQDADAHDEMLLSEFCLIPPGFAPWTFRLYEAISLLCIPIITEVHTFTLPFQDQLDWSKFSILLTTTVPKDVLAAAFDPKLTPSKIEEMRRELRYARRVFQYTSDTHYLLIHDMLAKAANHR